MYLISEALAESGITEALKAATEFCKKLFSPATEEIGYYLGDRVRTYRLRNMLKTLGKTQQMLEVVGIEPNSVPLRTLIPILEGASLEEDDILSEKWATLLANAAISEKQANMAHIYSTILSQLTPNDALVLDNLISNEYYFIDKQEVKEYLNIRHVIIESLNIHIDEYELSIDNLCRLGLCITNPPAISQQDIARIFHEMVPQLVRQDIVVLTRLGLSFIRACSGIHK